MEALFQLMQRCLLCSQDHPRPHLQRPEALHGDEPEALWWLHTTVQGWEKQVGALAVFTPDSQVVFSRQLLVAHWASVFYAFAFFFPPSAERRPSQKNARRPGSRLKTWPSQTHRWVSLRDGRLSLSRSFAAFCTMKQVPRVLWKPPLTLNCRPTLTPPPPFICVCFLDLFSIHTLSWCLSLEYFLLSSFILLMLHLPRWNIRQSQSIETV